MIKLLITQNTEIKLTPELIERFKQQVEDIGYDFHQEKLASRNTKDGLLFYYKTSGYIKKKPHYDGKLETGTSIRFTKQQKANFDKHNMRKVFQLICDDEDLCIATKELTDSYR